MIKIDLDFLLKDLEGNELKDGHAGKLIGNNLVSGSKGDVLKYYDWAVDLYNKRPISVDRVDLDKIKKFIEENEMITILAKGQILEVLKNAEIK